jgi:hypothetical protein
VAAVLAASGLLTWFTVNLDPNPALKAAGFGVGSGGAWYASIPVGWILLVVGIALGVAGSQIARDKLDQRHTKLAVACFLLSSATFVFILIERAHVHAQVPRDLAQSTVALLESRPELKDRIEEQLSRIVVKDGVGMWVALAAATTLATTAAVLALKSRKISGREAA